MHKQQAVAEDLVRVYDHCLEQQILERGSSLPCTDEKLWRQVEEMLKNGDARDTHCLGLDPLRVMEDSLKASAAITARGRRVKVRVGLKDLAKVFEFLEQASLNLYLGPWRKEYKVIKMYSGRFTHYVRPVLSMPQIETLFGLLGYKYGLSEPEQLLLQPSRVNPSSLNQFLHLSCAFFVARCECRLLWAALRNHPSGAQWELSVVNERQRGNTLQVALENTVKRFDVKQPLVEQTDLEEDLYRDEDTDGTKDVDVSDMKTSASSAWPVQKSLSPTLQLETLRGSAATKGPGKWSFEESDKMDSLEMNMPLDDKAEPETNRSCSCLNSPDLVLMKCFTCNTLHNFSCDYLQMCQRQHRVDYAIERPNGSIEGSAADSPPGDDPDAQLLKPISFHPCCDLTKGDPQVLCRSCNVFHSASCGDADLCQDQHDFCPLGVCFCGKACSRNPMVLCRYCGREYCKDCWYRRPVACICGQTYDQSTAV
uniref:Spermatogenesis-associated protein 2 PUB-like domain-containing protein n=1 Tax=Oryzias sinensis TaxID=183150 RepID=A0A8C7ZIQ7_9TELE